MGLFVEEGAAQALPAYPTAYRPPEAGYWVLKTPRFDVIFESGFEDEARETSAILEAHYDSSRAFVGGQRAFRMPVVLNGNNDVANGFVTPFPFRQEIEATAIKGSRLSSRFPSWLWAVTPHEMLHAAHAEGGDGFGVGALVRPFAPDLVRAMTLWMPRGLVEGAAVQYESNLFPNAGRLHHAPFQMQFRAAMLAEKPWSLAQMLETPLYDMQGDRMYIGGSYFFAHVAQRQGLGFFQHMVDQQYRFPLLGSGVGLRRATGRSPQSWWRSLRDSVQSAEEAWWTAQLRPELLEQITGKPGESYRHPLWLTDSTLVVYATGNAKRAGFYHVDLESGEEHLISAQRITEDLTVSINQDRTDVLFSRYVRDAFSSKQAVAEAFRMELATGKTTRLTTNGRVFAPVEVAGDIWAFQNHGPYTHWVDVQQDGSTHRLANSDRIQHQAIYPSPDGEIIAILLNKNGQQGLHQAQFDGEGKAALVPWLVFAEAHIYDAAWSPDSRYLLFTADFDTRLNVYVLDTHTEALHQLTNVPFGALEPSVSPDGKWLVFVNYMHEAYTVSRLPFQPKQAPHIHPVRRQPSEHQSEQVITPAFVEREPEPYHPLSYLHPRLFYPTVAYDTDDGALQGLGFGAGLAVEGVDPLERWAYGASAYVQAGQVWGNIAVQSGRYLLRPYLVAYDTPSAVRVRVNDGTETRLHSALRERRGVGFGVRLPVVLASNVYTTSLVASVQAGWEQEQISLRSGEVLLPYDHRLTLSPSLQWAYRLQANRRDLIPNTGWVLRTRGTLDVLRDKARPRQAIQGTLSRYLPVSLSTHTGVQLQAGLLSQNEPLVESASTFLPRGHEDVFLDAGTFGRMGATVVQPLRFIEDGSVLVPLYLHVLYAYGFAETVYDIHSSSDWAHRSSVGGGLGLQFRFYYAFNVDLRFGVAYRVEEKTWGVTFR